MITNEKIVYERVGELIIFIFILFKTTTVFMLLTFLQIPISAVLSEVFT